MICTECHAQKEIKIRIKKRSEQKALEHIFSPLLNFSKEDKLIKFEMLNDSLIVLNKGNKHNINDSLLNFSTVFRIRAKDSSGITATVKVLDLPNSSLKHVIKIKIQMLQTSSIEMSVFSSYSPYVYIIKLSEQSDGFFTCSSIAKEEYE
jgi:hypothetical protein